MKDFTFLTKDQCYNSYDSSTELDIFHKRGQEAKVTDFSVLLGAFLFDVNDFEFVNYNNEDARGFYWTKSTIDLVNGEKKVFCHSGKDCLVKEDLLICDTGARIALPYTSLGQISTNGKPPHRSQDGVLEVEYGFYPQDAIPKEKEEELDDLLSGKLQNGTLRKTGNYYNVETWNNKDPFETEIKLQGLHHFTEYKYKDERFVRVSPLIRPSDKVSLSNGRTYYTSTSAWIKVMPIKWLIDEKEKLMVSEKILFAGIPYNKDYNNYDKFEKTSIKLFIDQYFSKDILKARSMELNQRDKMRELNEINNIEQNKVEKNDKNNAVKRMNPYGFDFSNVSEEDIIRGTVEAGVAVFLHGKSGDGKSARVKQIDPDPEIIYLRNATPESLNGKSVYNQQTGEMIDVKPTWLQKLETKCESEKDKVHIVFLDELTNALPSIQGMAFNLVLDREVNGKWKLPDNARIVAAGNDMDDSLAANEIAEPLFNRFSHVYINTTPENWLAWAASPKGKYEKIDYKKEENEMNIHPSIYAFIAYKSYKGNDALRTRYNGKTPNADPRKWEMASKVLYTTKNPQMLRGLIGEELTEEFVEFCKTQVISVDDVLEGKIKGENLKMNLAEKYSTAVGLCSVDEENVEKVRNFVSCFGNEILSTFDNLWIHGDEKRLEKIAELRDHTLEDLERFNDKLIVKDENINIKDEEDNKKNKNKKPGKKTRTIQNKGLHQEVYDNMQEAKKTNNKQNNKTITVKPLDRDYNKIKENQKEYKVFKERDDEL